MLLFPLINLHLHIHIHRRKEKKSNPSVATSGSHLFYISIIPFCSLTWIWHSYLLYLGLFGLSLNSTEPIPILLFLHWLHTCPQVISSNETCSIWQCLSYLWFTILASDLGICNKRHHTHIITVLSYKYLGLSSQTFLEYLEIQILCLLRGTIPAGIKT